MKRASAALVSRAEFRQGVLDRAEQILMRLHGPCIHCRHAAAGAIRLAEVTVAELVDAVMAAHGE